MAPVTDRRGLLQALVKDGRPLIVLAALALLPTPFTSRRQFSERRSLRSPSH